MKTPIRIFLPLIFLLLLLQPEAKAQDGWNFGLDGGLNLAWINSAPVTGEPLPGDFGTRLSYTAGLFAEYGFNRRFFFQVGLNLDQRGFSYKESSDNKSVDLTVRASYLEVPLLFRYAFLVKDNFALYGLAGPSFAYLTGGRIKGEKVYNGESHDVNDKITDAYNSTAFGMKIGLGFEIPFADDNGATFFDVRYNYGFTDNIRQAGYYENSNIDANSHVVSFVVGVKGYIE